MRGKDEAGALVQQEFGDGERAACDEVHGLAAVGRMARIRHVQQRFMRQIGANSPQHRQPPHPGIEHANWRVVIIHPSLISYRPRLARAT